MKKKYVKPQAVTIKSVKREFPAALIASVASPLRGVACPQMLVSPRSVLQ